MASETFFTYEHFIMLYIATQFYFEGGVTYMTSSNLTLSPKCAVNRNKTAVAQLTNISSICRRTRASMGCIKPVDNEHKKLLYIIEKCQQLKYFNEEGALLEYFKSTGRYSTVAFVKSIYLRYIPFTDMLGIVT